MIQRSHHSTFFKHTPSAAVWITTRKTVWGRRHMSSSGSILHCCPNSNKRPLFVFEQLRNSLRRRRRRRICYASRELIKRYWLSPWPQCFTHNLYADNKMWRRPFPAAAMLANTPFFFPHKQYQVLRKKSKVPLPRSDVPRAANRQHHHQILKHTHCTCTTC